MDSIREAAVKCGRNAEEIKLVAVSKTFGIDVIREAFDAGLRDFGENKAQELRDKASSIGYPVNWHYIGGLQSNKVKYVVGVASLIHSVDSMKLAQEIAARAERTGVVQPVLLEYKTSGEDTKGGIESKEELYQIAEFCRDYKSLLLRGLMTMAPFVDDEAVIRKSFSALRQIREEMINAGFAMAELSMGMTGDYEIAIEEGATILRIGTAIFGSR